MKLSQLSALALLAAAPIAISAPAVAADLSGIWQIKSYSKTLAPETGEVPLNKAGKAAYDKVKVQAAKGDMSFDEVLTACLPPGLPRLMLIDKPFEIIQKPKTVFFVHQENRLPRKVFMDEALPTDDPELLYDGYSVGKWEGDTLVVKSLGFRAGTLLDDSGLPHSTSLKLEERFRLLADGSLESRMTIDDPKVFSKPWTSVALFVKKPDYIFREEVCAERLKTTAPGQRAPIK